MKKTPMGAALSFLINAKCENISCCTSVAAVQPPVVRRTGGFLSRYLYWVDAALGTLNWALLPEGAYTGARLAAWISSNFATQDCSTQSCGLFFLNIFFIVIFFLFFFFLFFLFFFIFYPARGASSPSLSPWMFLDDSYLTKKKGETKS